MSMSQARVLECPAPMPPLLSQVTTSSSQLVQQSTPCSGCNLVHMHTAETADLCYTYKWIVNTSRPHTMLNSLLNLRSALASACKHMGQLEWGLSGARPAHRFTDATHTFERSCLQTSLVLGMFVTRGLRISCTAYGLNDTGILGGLQVQ